LQFLLPVDDNKQELVFQISLSDVSEKIKTMTRLKIGEGVAAALPSRLKFKAQGAILSMITFGGILFCEDGFR
jgi:hypothetical protein